MMNMLGFLSAALLLLVALTAITLRKTYYYLPPKELKRQAEAGDNLAATLYRAVAYGNSLRALLWLIIGLSSAGGFLVLAAIAPPLLGLLLIASLLWLAFSWLPNTRVTAVGARLASWLTPAIAWLLTYLHPVLSRLVEPMYRHYQADHTRLYDADDLLELVERQSTQGDNRMSPDQLEAVKRTLTAHQYKVADVMRPRSQVKSISDSDTISLVLLDELHASGQSSFPVRQGRSDKIIGSLYLHDLNLKTEGSVRDYMHKDVRYLHEDDTLMQALQAFYKTKQQLFVVVNSFEEYVGIATLENIMQQLTGETKADDFDQHGDMAAVANKHAHDDDPLPETEEPEPEIAEEPVVEDEAEPEAAAEEPESEPKEAEDGDDEFEAVIDESDGPPLEPETKEPSEVESLSMEDETESADEPLTENPDELAALDLPDETAEDDVVGSHVDFEKPKTKKAKKPTAKTPESDAEVVE